MRRRFYVTMLVATGMVCGWGSIACSGIQPPQIPNDWDLLMLRLVNRARTDPAAENALQNSNYAETAVPPLAYDPYVGLAAENHNQWMWENRNNPAIDDPSNITAAPDSFSHYETLNAQASGTAATSTPGYTGAGIGARLSYAGYSWSAGGENILWRSPGTEINTSLVTLNHDDWWSSAGHRSNIMSPNFTAFGHSALSADQHFATQNFGRPLTSNTRNHLFGLLYDDLNRSGDWEPFASDSPDREGIGAARLRVLNATTGAEVRVVYSMDNGAYSVPLQNGTYDVEYLVPGLNILHRLESIALNGSNVDLGDVDRSLLASRPLGDANGDLKIDAQDFNIWNDNKYQSGKWWATGDFNGDGLANDLDFSIWNDHRFTTIAAAMAVPETAGVTGWFGFVFLLARIGRRTS